MLEEVIAFLNDKNREYAKGEADYNWSVWADNCAHTLRNALPYPQTSSWIWRSSAPRGTSATIGKFNKTDPDETRSMNSIGCPRDTARC